MLKSYLTIALRNLRRHKSYAFINIFGLAVGLAACCLILLYVRDELLFESMHKRADRIYRVHLEGALAGQTFNSATTSAPMAAALRQDYPEVESAARIWGTGRVLLRSGDRSFYEEDFFWADSTVFEVFSFHFLQGNARTALNRPDGLVITESTARRYFGEADPLGKTLTLDNQLDLTVTGVISDMPDNTHFQFDMLGALLSQDRSRSPEWIGNSFYTYVLLREGHAGDVLEAKFPDLVRTYAGPQLQQATGQSYEALLTSGVRYGFYLMPLRDIHLHSKAENDFAVNGDIQYVYILLAVAVFIVLIACINFMNLSTARSANRAREVGLRKVLGSDRRRLVQQFLGESVLMAIVAMVIALALMVALLPVMNTLSGKSLSLDLFRDPAIALGLLGVALTAGLLAGLYPAVVLSSFRPIEILKGQFTTGARGLWMRRVLVVTQFAISMMLLVGTGVMYNQLRFMQERDLGFRGAQAVVLPIETEAMRRHYPALSDALQAHPGVEHVAAGNGVPGRFMNDTVFRPEGGTNEDLKNLKVASISDTYIETLGLEMAAGRPFSSDVTSDSTQAFLLNETGARLFGWSPEEAVGKKVAWVSRNDDGTDEMRTVVGVVRDFHLESMQLEIKGMIFYPGPQAFTNVVVRVRPGDMPATLAFLESTWTTYEPGFPFRYFFLDEDFGRLFERERRLGQMFTGFTALAILIACLGLFGLASFITQQRTKEIGVRKVLGASVPVILLMLSREFTRMVLWACVLAFPVAWFVMDRWMDGFAYRTELGWGVFALAGLATLLIAWLTVGYQSIKAALADPVKSLRYE
ncbi:MAG: ABC transporter permease [Rhodothermales bacterium]|nr:ABC transporter permease [Rhodothermales bacterium]